MNTEKTLGSILLETDYLLQNNRNSEALWLMEKYTSELLTALALVDFKINRNFEKSKSYLELSAHIDKGNWRTFGNLAHISDESHQYGYALDYIVKSIKYSENEDEPYYNAGVILMNLNRNEEAVSMFRNANSINPENHVNAYNLAIALLKLGQYKEGWELYERRFIAHKRLQVFRDRFSQPYWDGSDLKDKKLCIFSEQGMGDFIQFARFLPLIKGNFFLEVQEPIAKILKKYKVVSRSVHEFGEAPDCDVCVSIGSLPYLLGLNQESDYISKPYITKPKVKRTKKIGVCWAGNPDHQKDHTRSMFASDLIDLDCELVSLQKSEGSRRWNNQWVDINHGKDQLNLVEPEFNDYYELSKVIASCDLVLTVDTGVAHLSGAMGIPTYVMLPIVGDWRWGQKDTTIWYPSVKIFRQKTQGDWKSVIQEVKLFSSQI